VKQDDIHTSDDATQYLSDLMSGEGNPFHGRSHSEDARQKMSDWVSENHPYEGEELSEEHKRKISESVEETHWTHSDRREEICQKISEALTGELTGEDNPFYGKELSPESKEQLSRSLREYYRDNEHPMSGGSAPEGSGNCEWYDI
jgi:hypothetical protein